MSFNDNPQEPYSFGADQTKDKKNVIKTFWPEYIYDISPNQAILQHNEL
jgi:hypothetical protein